MPTQENQIYLAILIGLLFLLLVIAFTGIIVLRNYKKIRDLQKKLVHSLIEGSENEQLRISQNLHDDISPSLAIVSMYLQMIELKNTENKELLNKSLSVLNDTINKIRNLSHELSPHNITEKGLFPSIEEYIRNLNEIYQEEIIFTNQIGDHKFNDLHKVHIYRIIQEGINNALKHANATVIRVGFFKFNSEIHILIEDNGKGFNSNTISLLSQPTSKGIGLKNIYNRVTSINGKFFIESKENKGTKLLIIINT